MMYNNNNNNNIIIRHNFARLFFIINNRKTERNRGTNRMFVHGVMFIFSHKNSHMHVVWQKFIWV